MYLYKNQKLHANYSFNIKRGLCITNTVKVTLRPNNIGNGVTSYYRPLKRKSHNYHLSLSAFPITSNSLQSQAFSNAIFCWCSVCALPLKRDPMRLREHSFLSCLVYINGVRHSLKSEMFKLGGQSGFWRRHIGLGTF